MMRFLSVFCLWLALAGPSLASGFVPAGQCVVVLSSRPDLPAAIADVRARWQAHDITIYKSANGWYAVTAGTLPTAQAPHVLARDKAAGLIPQDALCSSGGNYVEEVTRLAARDTAGDDIMGTVNAAALSPADQRFVQLGLAFGGDYLGLLDGEWGRLSQSALDAYAARRFSSAPKNWQLAILAFETFSLIERDGWEMYYNEWLQMSYLFPFSVAREGQHSDIFRNWEHGTTSLRYSFARTDVDRASAIHDHVLDSHRSSDAPYSVRRDNFAVSSAIAPDGSMLYARSRFVAGNWSTVLLAAQRRDAAIFGAVTSSIADGFAPQVTIAPGGVLDRYITQALALAEEEEEDGPPEPQPAPGQSVSVPAAPPQVRSTGTGFVVSAQGDVLTNAHVIEGCAELRVGGMPAVLRDRSDSFDLALLSVEADKQVAFARFAPAPAPLNSDVTVIGYPLSQDLGGLNVTRGSVSAAKGLGGDASNMQITAPIQPGNSGGPVVDKSGGVVGVVVSKLDEQKFAAGRGITPQNVNFAIRGEIAKLFLFQNDIIAETVDPAATVDPVALAREASGYTLLVECR